MPTNDEDRANTGSPPVPSGERVKAGYQAAVALVSYEGQLIWRAFGTMLAANAGFLTVAGGLPAVFPKLRLAGTIVSVLGLLICFAWLLVLRRQFCYYRYWFAWARHFEVRYLAPEVQITSLGKTYGEGGSLEPSELVPSLPRFSWAGRLFRVEWLMAIVIVMFGGLYAIALWRSLAP